VEVQMSLDEKKCNRCHRKAHHKHHKDYNHKNNKPENLENLCTLCHAKEHNIEPSFTELKKLVAYYQKVQKLRVSVALTLKSFRNIELFCPDELTEQEKQLNKLEKKYAKKIEEYWEKNYNKYYRWAINLKGIGDVSIAKILSEINLSKVKSHTSLWAYAGLAPHQKRRKDNKSNWNHKLKTYCYQLADCMVKQRTPKYRAIYDKEKAKQINNDIKRGHAHNRAIRKLIKTFLKDLYKIREQETRNPKSKRPISFSPCSPQKMKERLK
jgi:hypothetical protein